GGHGGTNCDPNDKTGPAGFGPQHFVTTNGALPYTVYFENLPTASSTTRQVTVVDTFDTNLDIRTFRLGQVAFNHYSVTAPVNRSFFSTRLSLSDQATNLVADISAGIDVTTRSATWTITAIDLNTGAEPLDPNLGLLPPDTTNNVGQGYVTYTIAPVAGLGSGTVITNQAVITFENNAPINTPIATNTLDALPPSSSISPLPAVMLSTNVTVSWSGADDVNGSGVQSFKIFVSDNGSAYSLWFNTALYSNNVLVTSSVYNGQPGHAYRFYSTASDYAGNVEPTHTNADATVLISSNHPPVVSSLPDQVVNVGGSSRLIIPITDPGQAGALLGASVLGGASGVGVRILDGTNLLISLVPGAFTAGTTNVVQIVITNNGVPPLVSTQTFLVSIPDFVGPGIGPAATRTGQPVCLPLNLFTSTGLTNVQLIVNVPATGFTNWSVGLLSSALCAGSVQSLNSTQLLVNLSACQGHALLSSGQAIANLCLDVETNLISQFVYIPIAVTQAERADSSFVANVGTGYGRLVVVADKPLLELLGQATNTASLTLYGIQSSTNIVEATHSLSQPIFWQPIWQNLITNLVNPIAVPTGGSNSMFFRAKIP
ncbi:MAG: hypothetical protein C5B50_12740, partial [Verrucomicrobia bacterium]